MAVSNYLSTKSQVELNLSHNHKHHHREKNPRKTALATFVAFVIGGAIPLLPFLLASQSPLINSNKFLFASVLTALAFLCIGSFRSHITNKHPARTAIETFVIGGIAAAIAFLVGYLLRGLVA